MKSISTRLTLWYAIAATITAAVFMMLGRSMIEKNFIHGVDLLNDKEFEEIRSRLENEIPSKNKDLITSAIIEHTEIDAALFFFQVGTSDSNPFFISSNLAGHYLPAEVHGHRRITISNNELGLVRVAEYKLGTLDIHIGTSLETFEIFNQRLNRLFTLAIIAIFLTSLLIGYFLSCIALRPIESIRKTASKIDIDNLDQRIDIPDTGDEVAELATFLNRMFDRLEASFSQAQQFTADASHELKTPLSLIRLNAESLSKTAFKNDPKASQMLDGQLLLIDQLNRIINDLLILAKADSGVLKMRFEKSNLYQLIEDFAEDAKALCEDKNITFINDNFANASASIDTTWIRHLLFNLLSNALNHSPEGSTISIHSTNDSFYWNITIADGGPGIEEEHLQKVFNRFYRVNDAKNETGSGLGLSICKSIASAHHGSLALNNRSDEIGIVARFSIPIS